MTAYGETARQAIGAIGLAGHATPGSGSQLGLDVVYGEILRQASLQVAVGI